MSKIRKVTIIGGGVSGLAAGVLLARRGLQVQIVEATNKIGGCCATTNREGYIFSDGALWLVMLSALDHVFARIGMDRTSRLPLRKITDNMTLRTPTGAVVTFADGQPVHIDRPGSTVDTARMQKELDGLQQRWTPALRPFVDDLLLHPFSFWRFLRKAGWHLPKMLGSVAAELSRRISDEELRAALSGALLFTGLPPHKMSASQLLALVVMFREGYFLPEGGMGRIPDVLGDEFTALGGELTVSTHVEKITVRKGRVNGLTLRDGETIDTDAILSTVSGMRTFLELMDAQDVPAKMRSKAAKVPLSVNAFLTVQLGLANRVDVPSHFNYLLPLMRDQHKFIDPEEQDRGLMFFAVPTMTTPELAPSGGSVLEMFLPTPQDLPLTAWDEQRKERMVEEALETLSRLHKLDVVVRRVRSPQDYQRSMHLYKGKMLGLSPAIDPWNYFPHKTAVRGLFLAGQTTYPGFGVVPSMLSGVFAAEALLQS